MNLKKIIGAQVLLLILILNSCSKYEEVSLNGLSIALNVSTNLIDPINNELKDFEQIRTKSTLTPIWIEGDKVCVYSIAEDNTILFIDTCSVYSIGKNKNYAKITAEVSKECKGYFASYPYNIFNYVCGDRLDINSNLNYCGIIDIENIIPTGQFGDVSVITSWCNYYNNSFNFVARTSLLRINNPKTIYMPIVVTICYANNSTYITTYNTNFEEDDLYVTISAYPEKLKYIKIEYRPKGNNTKKYIKIVPKEQILPGSIYSYSIK